MNDVVCLYNSRSPFLNEFQSLTLFTYKNCTSYTTYFIEYYYCIFRKEIIFLFQKSIKLALGYIPNLPPPIWPSGIYTGIPWKTRYTKGYFIHPLFYTKCTNDWCAFVFQLRLRTVRVIRHCSIVTARMVPRVGSGKS